MDWFFLFDLGIPMSPCILVEPTQSRTLLVQMITEVYFREWLPKNKMVGLTGGGVRISEK